MTRRSDGFEGEALTAHNLTVSQPAVRHELEVAAGVEPLGFADVERACRPMWPFRKHERTCCCLDRPHRGRMIAVGMGYENVGDGLAAHRSEQRIDVGRIVRSGIDDRDLTSANDVTDR